MCQKKSDINEHLPVLRKYAERCGHITEMGVRGICSTWALLSALPLKMISYDIQDPSLWDGDIESVKETAQFYNINYTFYLASVLNLEIEETDLLFIDTWHSYKQLKQELMLHSSKVRQYIIFHDTVTYGHKDEKSYEHWGEQWIGENIGILPAIEEFLLENSRWNEIENLKNNNGLIVIQNEY